MEIKNKKIKTSMLYQKWPMKSNPRVNDALLFKQG